ncbi:MAG: hypothetical protein SPL13_02520 [Clostridia bacterium]|nr:hypothetical protein [Clostridia bacterium]
MQKFKYEKPLIEIYLRPEGEEDVLDFIGTSPNAGGGSGNSGGAGSGGDFNN